MNNLRRPQEIPHEVYDRHVKDSFWQGVVTGAMAAGIIIGLIAFVFAH